MRRRISYSALLAPLACTSTPSFDAALDADLLDFEEDAAEEGAFTEADFEAQLLDMEAEAATMD